MSPRRGRGFACLGPGFVRRGPEEQTAKVEALISGVVAVASRARKAAALVERGQFVAGLNEIKGAHLQRHSYTAKFLGILATARRMQNASALKTADEADRVSSAASTGVKRPLARLSGLPEERLTDSTCTVPRGRRKYTQRVST